MCAIAGGNNEKEVGRMLEKMRHRSPDGMGILSNGRGFFIGMGRLAIIDLKSSDLCPYTEDGYILSFNGELYNYLELRQELERLSWQFRSESDIEVCLKAYRHWGTKCLDKFNGMFAFAIYDPRKNSIFLARDIAGEKPLYFALKPFRFASEAKALGWDCVEFPPAHFAYFHLGKREFTYFQPYWKLKKRWLDLSTVQEQLEVLLEDAIKIRTRADVPYALYSSGGVDSSLISTFHNFKYRFHYEDGSYAKEFKRVAPKIVYHLDYPIQSFSPFGLWKLAEQASKKVKVVISGEGADELFGGYVRYVLPHFNYAAQKEFPSYKSMFYSAQSVTKLGWQEFNGNLRELLRMGDRMASAFGIENRCPFLDKRIIEFAFNLPDELKIDGFETKVILNRILRKRNPKYKSVEKHGLFCNVNRWLKSKDGFNKTDWLEYQNKLWREFQGK